MGTTKSWDVLDSKFEGCTSNGDPASSALTITYRSMHSTQDIGL